MGKQYLGMDQKLRNKGMIISTTTSDWWPQIVNTPLGSCGIEKNHLLFCYIQQCIMASLDYVEPKNYPNKLKKSEFSKTQEFIKYYSKKFLNNERVWFSKFNKLNKLQFMEIFKKEFLEELHESSLPKNFINFINNNVKKAK